MLDSPEGSEAGEPVVAEPPIGSITNVATRWLTTANYDLVIYSDRIVVVGGTSWRNVPPPSKERPAHYPRRTPDNRPWPEIHGRRAKWAAAMPDAEILACDAGNRVLLLRTVWLAQLSKRLGICTLRITLKDRGQLKFIWANARSGTTHTEARDVLKQALGDRVQ